MNSLQAEYRELHAAGVIDEATLLRQLALESGRVFTLFEELRFSFYAAIAAITTGIGLLLKNNLDRIGPLSLILGLALVAAGCYASALRARVRVRVRKQTHSLGADYILLLGALIVSADLGYAESQYHWLGNHWSAHLLILAVFHAATAYLLDSRLVLSVSLTSLAAWFGIEARAGELVRHDSAVSDSGIRELLCASVILTFRELHRRLGSERPFAQVLEHFAANLGFCGALALCFSLDTRFIGLAVLITLAIVAIRKGLTQAEEMFILYGIGYATVGICYLEAQLVKRPLAAAILELATVVAALVLLFRFRLQSRARA
jgi:hypothetical protein